MHNYYHCTMYVGDVVASISSQNNVYGAHKAIDGLYHYNDEPTMNNQYDSLVATQVEQSPWIELDL